MSYDIYGNPLQRGHCEVHPHLHEEYPCSVCIQENNNRNAQQQSESEHYEMMRLEHELELSQQRIAELEKYNIALAVESHNKSAGIQQQQARIAELEQRESELSATVEWLLKACELARDSYGEMLMTDPPREAWKANQVTAKLVEAIAATPHQNLNAVKRDAFIEGFNAGFTDCWITDEEEHADAAIEIANQRYPDQQGASRPFFYAYDFRLVAFG